MKANNFTQKSIEAINLATKFAKEYGNQQITSLHLLKALLSGEQEIPNKLIEAKDMKDEFISVEHLLYGIALSGSDKAKEILSTNGVTRDKLLKALQEVRGNVRVTSDNPESTYDVLEKYGVDLVERAK